MNRFFLLADDDNDDAELFEEALSNVAPGVDFKHVENGRAVFTYLGSLESRKPNIIFLDLNMPELSGWQCLAKLKNDTSLKDIPVIMYSTSSISRDKEIALELGAIGFLTKPSSFKMLTSILTQIAATPEADLKEAVRDISSQRA